MNKRKFKKQHKDYLSRLSLKRLVEWCNLYKRDIKVQREQQKESKHKNKIVYPKIDKIYIDWYKEKLR